MAWNICMDVNKIVPVYLKMLFNFTKHQMFWHNHYFATLTIMHAVIACLNYFLFSLVFKDFSLYTVTLVFLRNTLFVYFLVVGIFCFPDCVCQEGYYHHY